MIEGFENAFDSFREIQEHIDEVQAKINGVNGQRDAELEDIDAAIKTIEQNINERDNTHRLNLPPEAFQGYGGQTPQYYDDYEYYGTDEEIKKLELLYEKREARIKEIKETIL